MRSRLHRSKINLSGEIFHTNNESVRIYVITLAYNLLRINLIRRFTIHKNLKTSCDYAFSNPINPPVTKIKVSKTFDRSPNLSSHMPFPNPV